jgi:YqzL-like protein
MLKEFLWETFKKTGNIEAYVFYKEIEESDKTLSEVEKNNEEVASAG